MYLYIYIHIYIYTYIYIFTYIYIYIGHFKNELWGLAVKPATNYDGKMSDDYYTKNIYRFYVCSYQYLYVYKCTYIFMYKYV
jgi:hypothetical protein